MELKQRLQDDIKSAMRAGEKSRLQMLRTLHAAIRQREIDEQTELGDDGMLQVIEKQIKQRKDALHQYTEAGRDDLAEREQSEITILQDYLPAPLAPAELDRLIDTVVAETGAGSMADMGRVMAELKPRVQGRADMKAVSEAVRARLGA